MNALRQLERLFTPDIRVKIDTDGKISAFELLNQNAAMVYLNRGCMVLGIDYDAVLRAMDGLTFEVVD